MRNLASCLKGKAQEQSIPETKVDEEQSTAEIPETTIKSQPEPESEPNTEVPETQPEICEESEIIIPEPEDAGGVCKLVAVEQDCEEIPERENVTVRERSTALVDFAPTEVAELQNKIQDVALTSPRQEDASKEDGSKSPGLLLSPRSKLVKPPQSPRREPSNSGQVCPPPPAVVGPPPMPKK
mmetsp:Transcript_56582/g.85559  ORF Transcript_56582/g.85559 Transcript_56582/m.85559 type:complete len:183 (-) Transcript_56582:17-565(-)